MDLGEHIHRYDRFAAYFQELGVAIVGYDRRGHGRSEGKRGHTISYDAFLDEVDMLMTKTKEYYADLPFFYLVIAWEETWCSTISWSGTQK